MTSRITFLVIALFWVTMTYLLWRSEYVGHNRMGSSVPVELVWRKILTAPDNSSLDILHNGKKVGYCRWTANIGEDAAVGRILTDEAPADGPAPALANYRLNLEGNVVLNDSGSRLRFDTEVRLTTNHVWQGLDVRLNMRPTVWEVHTIASEETVRFITQDKSGRYERVSSMPICKIRARCCRISMCLRRSACWECSIRFLIRKTQRRPPRRFRWD
jgi:hypothetical protein